MKISYQNQLFTKINKLIIKWRIQISIKVTLLLRIPHNKKYKRRLLPFLWMTDKKRYQLYLQAKRYLSLNSKTYQNKKYNSVDNHNSWWFRKKKNNNSTQARKVMKNNNKTQQKEWQLLNQLHEWEIWIKSKLLSKEKIKKYLIAKPNKIFSIVFSLNINSSSFRIQLIMVYFMTRLILKYMDMSSSHPRSKCS